MSRKMPVVILSFACFFSLVFTAHAAEYKIDPQHSTVSFKIRHVFSWVHGSFDEFQGNFTYDPENPESWSVNATIDPASINTKVAPRDKHLRSADFFDVETYPEITFKSTEITDVTESGAKLHGILSMHGVEKEIVMDLETHGVAEDPWGNVLAGFTATTTLNRKDFGLNWNQVLETGQLLVGEDVKITIDVEGIQQ